MVIDGVTEVSLSVGKKKVQYSVHITPDITDLILGNDWMKKQGKLVWDFDRQQVQFGDGVDSPSAGVRSQLPSYRRRVRR